VAARLTTYVVVAIVSATLIAGLIVGAQRDDNDGPVDLIVHNARVYTADGDESIEEAVAIRGNQILRVGSNREINRLRRPQTIVIDAKGAAVLPGFNDSHVRFIDGGLSLGAVDLHGAETVDAVQKSLKLWAGAHPSRPWIRARRWMDAQFTETPTRQMLDAAVADRPVIVLSDDRRSAWVNSAALKRAGIMRRTPDPVEGTIVRDRRGEATGVLRGAAVALVERVAPKPGREDRAAALRAAVREANRHGITSVQSGGEAVEDFELYDEARKAEELTVRVYGALAMNGRLTDADIDRVGEVARKYPDDPLFKTGAAKLRVDGDVESRAASLTEPYADKPINAEPWIAPDDLNRTARILDSYGWQLMTQAAGDRAVNMALYAYAHAARSNATPPRGRRHRIEHPDLIAPEDLPRFRSIGVIASVKPQAASDLRTELLGPARAERAGAIDAVADARGRIALGSDWPDAPLDPLAVLDAATAPRRSATDNDRPAPGALTLTAAIDAYTTGAAYASFDEQRKGSLTPGMLADLVVLSDDIFAKTARPLTSTSVAVTIFDGKIVYKRATTN
jgi:predicted amidohydrolase YtcJ